VELAVFGALSALTIGLCFVLWPYAQYAGARDAERIRHERDLAAKRDEAGAALHNDLHGMRQELRAMSPRSSVGRAVSKK
jgi:hypothetical protein